MSDNAILAAMRRMGIGKDEMSSQARISSSSARVSPVGKVSRSVPLRHKATGWNSDCAALRGGAGRGGANLAHPCA